MVRQEFLGKGLSAAVAGRKPESSSVFPTSNKEVCDDFVSGLWKFRQPQGKSKGGRGQTSWLGVMRTVHSSQKHGRLQRRTCEGGTCEGDNSMSCTAVRGTRQQVVFVGIKTRKAVRSVWKNVHNNEKRMASKWAPQ
ncbi:hypothetical protein AMTR_s00037p00095060 [Amborella trichopoda]|uniref:Uncharacterized protein n=1 Tax=Amborella trichopoda TaxID=13333 RepID=U5CVG7_AMBTC|nr:hypothetical protein AMTR_s00037p00095060 [Amborella trichopoda]